MHIRTTRLLHGPNRYAMGPCCEIVFADDEVDGPRDDAGMPQRVARANVVGQTAVTLMRRAGGDGHVETVVASHDTTRLAVGYAPGDEALVESAVAVAANVVDAAYAGRPVGLQGSIAALRGLVADQGLDDATRALLDDARRRDLPVLPIDRDGATRGFQIGWGARQRRICLAGGDDAGAASPAGLLDGCGRIPVVAVTGTNGKTTTTVLIAHVSTASGARTGLTSTAGIVVDGRVVERGDCAGPLSARKVLMSPDVDVAVLETARGGLLRSGLAFDRCDVGVVLNIAADHLGLDGVETLEDLAHVKGIVARNAATMAVLNAEDPLCVAMRDTLRPGCEAVYFALDPTHPVVVRHLAAGGRAAVLDDGRLTWCDGDRRHAVVDPTALPFTLQGHARYNIANALAALAALVGLGHAPESIAGAMATFASDALQNPLRGNRFDVGGVTLVVDYAHNPVAYRALCEAARSMVSEPSQRLVGVITSPGDRRDEDLAEVGGICGAFFDELFVYEHHPRGRAPGETIEAILAGARTAAGDKPLHGVRSIRAALAAGLDASRPGDVLVFTCAGTLDDVVAGVRLANPAAAPAIAAAIGVAA